MDPTRSARLVIAAAASLTTAVGLVALAPTAGAATAASSTAHQAVIVVLKNQLTATPATTAHIAARHSAAVSAQDQVLRRLSGAAPTNVKKYTVGNAFAATVTAAQAAQLAADPDVASVVPDANVQVTPSTAPALPAQMAPKAKASAKASATATTGASTVSPNACSSNPNKPLLEPEALQSMNVRSDDPNAKTAAALGIDGTGVKVAYIADGINPNNAGFIRTNGKSSIVDYKDFYGDGPNAVTSGAEAFGDASAISAQGNVVYDVADYANPAVVSYPGGHCYIRIVGVAPGANVVALKAGSELLPNSAILQAIDYAVTTDHVDVINESFGSNVYPDTSARSTIQLFNDNAVKAGVTITESTGDAGVTSTIGSSSTDPMVISAGASTDSRIYAQTGYALADRFGNGSWLDDNISSLSSAGITQNGRTIDISAPGEGDWALCDDSGEFVGCTSFGNPDHPLANIQSFGGTSQSAPLTAGVAALVIQAYRKTHHAASPSPAVVKQIITSTAHDLGLPGQEQGSGLIDARAAVEAALTWPGDNTAAPAGTGQNISLSTNQVTISGAPGSTQSASVQVRNVGTKAQTITASNRRFNQIAAATQHLSIDAASSQTVPYPTTGAPWAYKKVTFTVPSGTDELNSVVRWNGGPAFGGGSGPVVRLSLFAPDGTYAANTRPQGGATPSNYGLAQVAHPAAGKWTAVLYTPQSGGYTGAVALDTRSYRAGSVGRVSPSTTTLAPGATATVKVTVPMPSAGGDGVNTLSIASSGGHQVAVPMILRAVVPVPGRFTGTITGGNARAFSPAQTFTYAFDVPKGQRDVQVNTMLASDPKDLLEGILIDPNDEVQSVSSNQLVSAAGRSMTNTVATPTPGRWRFVVVVQNPVTGNAYAQPFSGTVAFNQVKVSAPSLPAQLAKGKAVTEQVKVTNSGKAPMVVQTDARLNSSTTYQLAPQFAGSTIPLPLSVDDLSNIPSYLIPPDTSQLAVTSSATVPAQVELSSPTGGIDLFGDLTAAQHGSTVSTATVSESTPTVGLGFWGLYLQQIGPYGVKGAPAGSATLSAAGTMNRFDPAVTSSTGDIFLQTLDSSASAGTPLVINPGQTKAVTVTITPTAAVGSKVTGVLHLVTPPSGVQAAFNTTGEVLASLPYSYTVK